MNKNQLLKINNRLDKLKEEIQAIRNFFNGNSDITKHLMDSELSLLHAYYEIILICEEENKE